MRTQKTRRCRYRDCMRFAKWGHTVCPRHGTAGRRLKKGETWRGKDVVAQERQKARGG